MKTIESQTADTILQSPKKISIGGKEYEIARPNIATLIEVSKLISTAPEIPNSEDTLVKSLAIAQDAGVLTEILALLIVGHKKSNSLLSYHRKIKRKKLSKEICNELDTKEILDAIAELLKDMEVGFFLSIITFLNEVNLLRKTKI
jgi:hypothetical protein